MVANGFFVMLKVLPFLLLIVMPGPAAACTILIIGDSLSASYGIPVEQGWVALLQTRLSEQCPACRLVNASISGDTSAAARARLPQAMQRHQPQVAVLELGGNDGLRGLALEEMKQNLAAMIETARQQGAQVLLVGVQLPPNYGALYTERFEGVYRQLAREHGVALLASLVDGIGTRSELMQSDGVHPNARAQPLIMARVWDHLQPLLVEDGQGCGGD
jgi:acyl-CoA thioesterase-1